MLLLQSPPDQLPQGVLVFYYQYLHDTAKIRRKSGKELKKSQLFHIALEQGDDFGF